MKILYLSDYYNNKTGQPLNTIAEMMKKNGNDVKVYTSTKDVDPSGFDDSKSILEIIRFRTIRVFGRCFFPGLLKILFQKKPDIVHSYIFGFFSTTVSSYIKKIKGYKLVITSDVNVDENEPNLLKKIYIHLTRKIPASQANIIITYTKKQEKNLIEEMNIKPEKIQVVPIGIDWKKFSVKNEKMKKSMGLDKKFVILNVSNISSVKNLEMIINTVNLLKNKNIVFVHIGGVSDTAYKKKLENLIEKLNIKDKVFFMGHVPHQKIHRYYSMSDVYFQSSWRESYGITVLEAMASGKPIVTTCVGITRELGKDIGFFINNKEDAVKAIKQLYENKNKAKTIGNKNRELAKRYDWNNIIMKLQKIYNNLNVKNDVKI